MRECRECEVLIDRAHTGEASEEERDVLLEHLESCSECSDAFDALGRMRGEEFYPEPKSEELLSVRRAVIRQIRSADHKMSQRRLPIPSFILRSAAALAGALAMLVIGFYLGQGDQVPRERRELHYTGGSDGFMYTIKQVAQSHRAYEDIVNSPFTYTNVRVAKATNDTVNLSFDVSRHLDLSLRKDDSLLTEVLVQSLIEPAAVDTRLNAVSIAENVPDPKVKRFLILAMLHDENLAVRMNAQSKLVQHLGDAEIVDSLLTVLAREPSVRMRLVALDYLADIRVRPERLEKAVTAGKREGSDAVFIRANQYLNR